jgi:hypothetical protein
VHGLGRIEKLMRELAVAGVVLSVEGDRLAFDAPADVVTDNLLGRMRSDRAGLLALLDPGPGTVAETLPKAAPAVVAIVEAFEELSPDDVPPCDACGRYCDVETLAGRWCCLRCDPEADARRLRTERLMARSAAMKQNRT